MLSQDEVDDIAIDKELVAKEGFGEYMRQAWHVLEKVDCKWGWHNDAMADALQAVASGDIENLLINIPPGFTKSLSAASMFPSWDWINNPWRKYICATYGLDLTLRDARRHKRLVQSEWFQNRWGVGWDYERNKPLRGSLDRPGVYIPNEFSSAAGYFENNKGGYRFSAAVQAGVIGRHGNIIVGDDLVQGQDAKGRSAVTGEAIKKANEFWFDDLETRGLEDVRRILIMQRLHFDDPPSRCRKDGYSCLILPAEYVPSQKCFLHVTGFADPRTEEGELLHPDRFSAAILKKRKERLGDASYEAQFQQNPLPAKGGLFNVDTFKHWGVPGSKYPVLPPLHTMTLTQSWDMNFGEKLEAGSFVVGQVWARIGADHLLIHQVRGRWDVAETCAQLASVSADYKTFEKLVERKAAGPSVVRFLKNKISGFQLIDVSRSKTERVHAILPLFSGGNVFFPHPSIATFDVGAMELELRQFPLGSHDDQVDTLSQYLNENGYDSLSLLEEAMNNI